MDEHATDGRRRIVLVLGLIVVGILATQTAVLIWFVTSYVQTVPKLGDTLDNYIDSQIDAGSEDPTLRGDVQVAKMGQGHLPERRQPRPLVDQRKRVIDLRG